MSEPNAFPIATTEEGRLEIEYGLSKREYYAAQAMQGLIGQYSMKVELGMENFSVLAKSAVAMAIALERELKGAKELK